MGIKEPVNLYDHQKSPHYSSWPHLPHQMIKEDEKLKKEWRENGNIVCLAMLKLVRKSPSAECLHPADISSDVRARKSTKGKERERKEEWRLENMFL